MIRLRILAALVTLALLIGLLPSPAYAQEPPPSTFQECQAVDEATLRDELNRLAQQTFVQDQAALDLAGMVAAHWDALGVDAVIQAQVDAAVAQVRQDTGYWERFLSGWSGDKAEELAQRVASQAFGSTAFRAKMDELSQALGQDLAEALARMAARSASANLLCVQDFIGQRFSATMADLFTQEIQAELANVDFAQMDVDLGMPFLEANPKALAGLGVIVGAQVARRVATRIAERVAERVVGRILGKAAGTLIPLVGWVVGGGLIVWDLIEGADGALPQIRDHLVSPETGAAIQAQVVDELRLVLAEQSPNLARSVSNEIYSRWVDFRARYRRVLDWSEQDPRFRRLLEDAHPEDVERLARLVTVAEDVLAPEEAARFIGSQAFERILALGDVGVTLLAHSGDPAVVLAWADLAGASLEQVVAVELYRVASPGDFPDRDALEQVLALEDSDVIARIMVLPSERRRVLLRLPGAQVRRLIATLDTPDLDWLARYLRDMDPREGYALVDRILADPTLMQELRDEQIRQLVVNSSDPDEILAFLQSDAQQSPLQEATEVAEDARKVLQGNIPWLLFWRKYGPWPLVGLALALLLLVALVVRLVRPRPPVQVIVQHPREGEGQAAGRLPQQGED